MSNIEKHVDIKRIIKEYISLDDQISEINKQTKEIRKNKSDLEKTIKQYMIDNEHSKLDLGDSNGHLKISKSKQQKKINKKSIISALLEILEHEKVDKIVDHIFDGDDEDEVVKLERKTTKIKA